MHMCSKLTLLIGIHGGTLHLAAMHAQARAHVQRGDGGSGGLGKPRAGSEVQGIRH